MVSWLCSSRVVAVLAAVYLLGDLSECLLISFEERWMNPWKERDGLAGLAWRQGGI